MEADRRLVCLFEMAIAPHLLSTPPSPQVVHPEIEESGAFWQTWLI